MRGLAFALALCAGHVIAAAAPPPAVAVLYFDNDTGDPSYDPLGKGLADMMVTDLAGVPGLQIVEREKLEAILQELKLQRTRYFDPKTAQKIGRGVGAEYAITGSFVSVAPDIRIDVRVIRIGTGEVVTARKVTGQKERFFDLQQQLAAALIEGLGQKLAGRGVAEANRVDDLTTARDYGRGLDLRDRGDLRGASEQMQKVVEKAPRFALAKTRQMEILKALYAAKGTRERALESSEQRLLAFLDQRLEHAGDPTQTIAFRIVRGDVFLRRIAQSLDGPARDYRPHFAAYVQNQERLLDELLRYARAHPTMYDLSMTAECLKCIDTDTQALMRDLGIEHPGTARNVNPDGMIEAFVELVMFGIPPEGLNGPRVRFKRAVCFHKLDPAYAKTSLAWLGRALEAIEHQAASDKDRAGGWRDSHTIEVHQYEAVVHLALGQPEEAVAKLQGILTRYPKSSKFAETEKMLREVLSGTTTVLPPCDDPR